MSAPNRFSAHVEQCHQKATIAAADARRAAEEAEKARLHAAALLVGFLKGAVLTLLTEAAGALEAAGIRAEVGNGQTDGHPRHSLIIHYPEGQQDHRLTFEVFTSGTRPVLRATGRCPRLTPAESTQETARALESDVVGWINAFIAVAVA